MASPTLLTEPSETLAVELVRERDLGLRLSLLPWVVALTVSVPLAAAYLLLGLPSGDLAAATYRGDLFARFGFTLWDSGWYGATIFRAIRCWPRRSGRWSESGSYLR